MWRSAGPVRATSCAWIVGLVLVGAARADTISTDASYDRWMYPFNATPGTRGSAPTFGALDPGAPTFDNRDGQLHVGFDTDSAGVPAGLGAERYEIVSATVSVTHSVGAFLFDPTYDSYQTYDGTLTDPDPGRPVELHGLGFRAPFSAIELSPGIPGPPGFEETDAFAFSDPTLPGVRNAFPVNPALADVSNNVDDGVESQAWAIGQALGVDPGDPVVEGVSGVSPGTTFEFSLDLSDPGIVAYLQEGLDAGVLGFAITSLHLTEMSGGTTPNFFTANTLDPAAVPPMLDLEFNLVPEPGPAALWVGAGVALARVGRRRSRRRMS